MRKLVFLALIPAVLYLAGCSQNTTDPVNTQEVQNLEKRGVSKEVHHMLQEVKAATARYHNINHAIADGYADIHVVVPGMGHHYLKAALLDSVFHHTHPEILVYQKMANGHFKLVAVEYAVPLSYPKPEGFPGSYDTWTPNTGAGIWALHAWIWKKNPDGVFASFNPLVP